MIARLSLSRRVVLIAALALLALWLGAISAFYLNRGVEQTAGLPPPASIAALAELLDHASPEDRALILAAAERPGLTIRIEATPAEAAALPALLGPEATVLEGYREALAGRELAVIPRRRRIDWAMASALTDVEFRVGLAGSGTLVVTSESPIFVTPFGMPVGFGAGVIGLLVALAALILLNREFRPLSRLAEAVDQADPSLPLPPIRARSPELKALIAAFERLQARLAVLIRARMALVGGIQHDLRTFATRLRLRTDQIADPVERDRAATDIGHMIALLDDALLASRAGASELDEELVDLAALVAAEVADRQYGRRARRSGARAGGRRGDRARRPPRAPPDRREPGRQRAEIRARRPSRSRSRP